MNFLNIIFIFFLYFCIMPGCNSSLSYNYERFNRKRMLGSGRRHIPPFGESHREAFPQPMPQRKSKSTPVPLPYHNLYQGRRKREDKRVYRKRFSLAGHPAGQLVTFDELFDCPLTFLAVETESNIPIVLRGGVGHLYFNIIIKVRPYDGASGQVRAYCQKTELDYYKEKQTPNVAKVYVFAATTEMPSQEYLA
ncbi:uncharacterized protein LOC128670659 [Plodia interpunctella]|uniref:uncharacterized protein LOC128670659 n=1 Tax=Plodia interpunctella TaxID=58824 RepID=UPI002368BA55|nr:uncharacterized protein LOC128670659 [Plodia interpunctella]